MSTTPAPAADDLIAALISAANDARKEGRAVEMERLLDEVADLLEV